MLRDEEPERTGPAGGSPAHPLTLHKKLLFAAVAVGAVLFALEGTARLVAQPREASLHEEHAGLIEVLGLPALNATMQFDPELFWRLRDELDEVPVRGQVRGVDVDFRVSTRGGLRVTPHSSAGARRRILALGDSCTFGLGVDDAQTWPAQLAQRIAPTYDVEVVNAGVPGYSAYQGLRFLETRGDALAPDLIVATFGFNDEDQWSSRSDYETAALLEAPGWEAALAHSGLYRALRQLLPAARAAAPLPRRLDPGAATGSPRLSPKQFVQTLHGIASYARERGVALVFATWPFREQVERGIHQPIHYQALVARAGAEASVPVVSLSGAFIDAGGEAFLDHVHATPAGNRIASAALRPVLLAELALESRDVFASRSQSSSVRGRIASALQ